MMDNINYFKKDEIISDMNKKGWKYKDDSIINPNTKKPMNISKFTNKNGDEIELIVIYYNNTNIPSEWTLFIKLAKDTHRTLSGSGKFNNYTRDDDLSQFMLYKYSSHIQFERDMELNERAGKNKQILMNAIKEIVKEEVGKSTNFSVRELLKEKNNIKLYEDLLGKATTVLGNDSPLISIITKYFRSGTEEIKQEVSAMINSLWRVHLRSIGK